MQQLEIVVKHRPVTKSYFLEATLNGKYFGRKEITFTKGGSEKEVVANILNISVPPSINKKRKN